MATVKQIYSELDALIPRALSCPWDNDGLMVCPDGGSEVERVLLSLDATAAVCREAAGFDLILTHHPMIFRRLSSVTDENFISEKVISLIGGGTSVMSFHTRFDACDGGMNDILAEKFGLSDTVKFGDAESPTLGRIGTISPVTAAALCDTAKKILGAPRVLLSDSGKTITRLAVCGGGGKSMIIPALDMGADALLTGECDYNAAIDARDAGLTVIEAGHYYTEAVFAGFFERFFDENHPDITVVRSHVGCEIKTL